MALFSRKTKEVEKTAATAPAAQKKSAAEVSGTTMAGLMHVLRNPRITEKASQVQEASVYTFDIAPGATKRQISAAVRALYKVTPRKIAVVSIPPKKRRNMRTGKRGISPGGRKAYVYLKAGETITVH